MEQPAALNATEKFVEDLWGMVDHLLGEMAALTMRGGNHDKADEFRVNRENLRLKMKRWELERDAEHGDDSAIQILEQEMHRELLARIKNAPKSPNDDFDDIPF